MWTVFGSVPGFTDSGSANTQFYMRPHQQNISGVACPCVSHWRSLHCVTLLSVSMSSPWVCVCVFQFTLCSQCGWVCISSPPSSVFLSLWVKNHDDEWFGKTVDLLSLSFPSSFSVFTTVTFLSDVFAIFKIIVQFQTLTDAEAETYLTYLQWIFDKLFNNDSYKISTHLWVFCPLNLTLEGWKWCE